MVREGDKIKDVMAYIDFRIQHLVLERQKVPYVVEEDIREKVINKLDAKIHELRRTKRIFHSDIKKSSKFECSKVNYLKKLKIKKQRQKQNGKNKIRK